MVSIRRKTDDISMYMSLLSCNEKDATGEVKIYENESEYYAYTL